MRFVAPEVVRIDLPNGDWIDVKKWLTAAEENRYRTRAFKGMRAETRPDSPDEVKATEIGVDWTMLAVARVEAYVVEWSARDEKGHPIPVTLDTIGRLHPDDFKVLDDAVKAHVEAMADEKKATGSSPMPDSPSA